jgi:arginase family enzyme
MDFPKPVDSMVYPRHGGIATFMRLPHISDPRELDVAFVGVPFDTSAGYRVGARLGPSASVPARSACTTPCTT